MTAFGKLIRTTAFRLTLVYLFLFALFAASLLGYFAWNTRRLINEQITTTVNAEIAEIDDIYTRRGLARPGRHASATARCGPAPTSISSPRRTGRAFGGNVGSLAPGVMASTGWSETAYRRLDEQDTADHRALVRVTELTNGFRLLVGRDLEERGGCSASSPRPRNGRCWSSSCSASAAASSWRGACCGGSTP